MGMSKRIDRYFIMRYTYQSMYKLFHFMREVSKYANVMAKEPIKYVRRYLY